MYDNTANSQINNSAGHMIKFVGKVVDKLCIALSDT